MAPLIGAKTEPESFAFVWFAGQLMPHRPADSNRLVVPIGNAVAP